MVLQVNYTGVAMLVTLRYTIVSKTEVMNFHYSTTMCTQLRWFPIVVWPILLNPDNHGPQIL